APEGKTYSKVVIKAGSGADENTVYTTRLTAGASFTHATKDSISHVIVCAVPTPRTVVADFPAPTSVDVCGTENDKVNLPQSNQVSYAKTDQRNGGVGTVIVTASAKPGFALKDGVTKSWTFTFTNEPCDGVISVFPAPTASDVCGTANDGFSVPAHSDEVSYVVDDQRTHGVGTVTVTATANAGFTFADNVRTVWEFEFTDGDCSRTVVPATPGVNGELCFLGDFIAGSINVELNDRLTYRITGDGVDMVATQAITNVAPGTYTVRALAKPGHVLDGQSAWQVTVAAAQACGELETHPLVTPLASMTSLGCDTNGSYTLNAIDGVLWFVDGEPAAAGTYPVTAPSTVHVTAQADGPEYGLEFEAQTEWTFTFTAAEACGDLETLALTGAQYGNVVLLSTGLLLLFGGTALALSRIKRLRVE
ncbi:MAG TPA: hypothetical protein VFT01_11345, partial [Homoserinimonas sp.]|nr:hypothetical protein [Homoserinimonas sp.]